MLSVVQVTYPNQKWQLLSQFQPQNQTWLVSDLRSKLELQDWLLSARPGYEDNVVLRASELWKLLLKRSQPQLNIVSVDYFKTWLKDYIDFRSQIKMGGSTEEVLYKILDQFVPVYADPLGTQRVNDWLKDNIKALGRWGGWFLTGQEIFEKALKENAVPMRWAASLLNGPAQMDLNWDRPLIVDLGAELSMVEAEVLRQLSKKIDVLVIAPQTSWDHDYKHLLHPYEMLTGFADSVRTLQPTDADHSQKQYLKFSSVLAEAKHVTSQIRQWIESGISAKNILVSAVQIENYWPLLSEFFLQEGIPTAKDTTARAQNFPACLKWLASMRWAAQKVEFSDLEILEYFNQNDIQNNYAEFRALFVRILDEKDLERDSRIKKLFDNTKWNLKDLSLDEFIRLSLGLWPTWASTDLLVPILKDILATRETTQKMHIKSWLHWLELLIAKKEFLLKPAQEAGVQVVSLTSADSRQATHRVFLGLSESQFQVKNSPLMDPQEISKLGQDLGYYLNHPEELSIDYELMWLSLDKTAVSHFCTVATTFSGSVDSPHPFWLEHKTHADLNFPHATRWDSIQDHVSNSVIERALRQDQGIEKLDDWPLENIPRFSASSFERYRACSFIYAAEKLFRLKDLPEVDLDLDARKKGDLAHALFEQILKQGLEKKWDDATLLNLIDQLKVELKLPLYEQATWQAFRERHLKLAKRFLDFENKLRVQFPKLKTLAVEQEFKTYFDLASSQFVAQSGPGTVEWVGKIDRIDGTGLGQAMIIDYKPSDRSEHAFSSWFEKNKLQLGFYAMVLEEGLIDDLQQQDVLAALYYVYRDFSIKKGFRVAEKAGSLYESSAKNKFSEQDKKDFYVRLKEEVSSVMKSVQAGDFKPQPRDEELCTKCSWRGLCRAPHLQI